VDVEGNSSESSQLYINPALSQAPYSAGGEVAYKVHTSQPTARVEPFIRTVLLAHTLQGGRQ